MPFVALRGLPRGRTKSCDTNYCSTFATLALGLQQPAHAATGFSRTEAPKVAFLFFAEKTTVAGRHALREARGQEWSRPSAMKIPSSRTCRGAAAARQIKTCRRGLIKRGLTTSSSPPPRLFRCLKEMAEKYPKGRVPEWGPARPTGPNLESFYGRTYEEPQYLCLCGMAAGGHMSKTGSSDFVAHTRAARDWTITLRARRQAAEPQMRPLT